MQVLLKLTSNRPFELSAFITYLGRRPAPSEDWLVLPPDNHVHTEWSWDAPLGSMERSCAQALKLGLPSIAFTEHADFTRWIVGPKELEQLPIDAAEVGPDGVFNAPIFNIAEYLDCLDRCRYHFPNLRIVSGVELGEPHWYQAQMKALLAERTPDRVLGSLHSLMVDGPRMVDFLYGRFEASDLMHAYLAEILALVESSATFAVLAHIDYPVRNWPSSAGHFDPVNFEEEYREVLRALARSGRALEINTRVPMGPEIVRWWWELGGRAVTFGSDAHEPADVANSFADAAAMAEAFGFGPGRHLHDFWVRSTYR